MATKITLNEKELALRLALSVKTIQSWRQKGSGPCFARYGRSIRYPIEAVERFEADCLQGGAND